MSRPFLEEIDQLIRARYALVYVVTWEEERARQLLLQVAAKQRKEMYEWSVTDGLRHVTHPGASSPRGDDRRREPINVLNDILQSDANGLFVLKDFHAWLDRPEVVRHLRDLAHILRRTRKTLIILAPVLNLPQELEKSVTIVDLPLPDYEDISALLNKTIGGGERNYRVNLNDIDRDAMIKAALGLTHAEAENAFAKAIVGDGVLDASGIEVINEEKRQIVRKTRVLECVDVHESIAGVGGMDLLKDWLRKRVRAFSEDARHYGLPQPRGILLLGVQGCGKSLVAKTIAYSWRLPLLRLDMSRIFESYMGSSEQNMRRATTIAESIAPVVLWIDEIEKAFAGSRGSSEFDGGTATRVLGTFLTWMQEKSKPVFIVATANEIEGLPPELLRKGRLDEIFFVDLPAEAERKEIFAIHLKKKKRDPARYELDRMAAHSEGFSGAEIEQAVVSALHDSFFEQRDVTSADVLRSLEETVPMSATMREKIAALREWSLTRARPVSTHQPRPKRAE